MAGIIAMGELAHELESLITRIETGLAQRRRECARRGAGRRSMNCRACARRSPPGVRAAALQALIARIQSAASRHSGGGRRHRARSSQPIPESPGTPPASRSASQPPPGREPASFEQTSEAPDPQPPHAAIARVHGTAGQYCRSTSSRRCALETAGEQPRPAVSLEASTPPQPPVETAAAATHAPPAPAAPLPPGREPVAAADRVEMARVSAELLDQLLNNAGEVSISRARLEQQLGSIEFNLGELSRTVTRLKEQLRKLEIETEAQILHRHENEAGHRAGFDPLELDRYSSIQQFSRALAESANDVGQHPGPAREPDRRGAEPAAAAVAHRHRAAERADAHAHGVAAAARAAPGAHRAPGAPPIPASGRAASSRAPRASSIGRCSSACCRRSSTCCATPWCTASRSPEARRAAGKDETGHIRLNLQREGAEVIVEVSDDGAGMNLAAIRAKGLELGLIRPDQELSDEDVMQLVLEPGFSTASSLTQQAGRGVGMDVVAVEIKKLGGALHMESTPGRGTRFTIRLPFTLAISHALVVRTGDEYYALPLPTVEGVVRLARDEVADASARRQRQLQPRRPEVPPAAAGAVRRHGSPRRCPSRTSRFRWCWCAPASIPPAWWPMS